MERSREKTSLGRVLGERLEQVFCHDLALALEITVEVYLEVAIPSQHARAGLLRVKCGQCGLVRASQNRKGPVQVRCSFHEGKVQFSSGLSSIANVYRNRAVFVQFGK